MKINNWTKILPWHPTRRWSKRSVNTINKVIVHQSMSTGNLLSINNYHISFNNHISKKACPHICYHYCIDKEGSVYKTNPISSTVWHCGKQNTSSIGILVIGNFTGPSYAGSEVPTEIQLAALRYLLLDVLLLDTKIAPRVGKTDIYGHAEFGKENCPGTVISEFLDRLKA